MGVPFRAEPPPPLFPGERGWGVAKPCAGGPPLKPPAAPYPGCPVTDFTPKWRKDSEIMFMLHISPLL